MSTHTHKREKYVSNEELTAIELGTFEQETTRMRVSDPCYDKETWCAGTIENVRPGVYEAVVGQSDEGGWGVRVAELSIRHEDAGRNRIEWHESDIDVGVDSGQAGVFDDKYFKCDSEADGYKHECDKICADEAFYSMCCDLTIRPQQAGVLPHGCVSSSGYGDGSYVCQVGEQDGEVVALRIIFISCCSGDE